jgi:hypothetical protein
MSRAAQHCHELESGGLLLFPRTPFEFPAEDQEFLCGVRQAAGRHHKNIAYRPLEDRVTGTSARGAEAERLHRVLRDYSCRATEFLSGLLAPYAQDWRLDYASFRPHQEQGREVRLRARNDLLHVDAFPTRPTHGDLILRIFTNINPTEPRCWITGEPFPELVARLRGEPGFPAVRPIEDGLAARLMRTLRRGLAVAGLPLRARSPYDEFMLALHHWLKENAAWQAECPKRTWSFPPGSTWIAFTDVLPHAALAGQFALEQTLIVSRRSLLLPERAPAAVLERIAGGPVTLPVPRAAQSAARRAA